MELAGDFDSISSYSVPIKTPASLFIPKFSDSFDSGAFHALYDPFSYPSIGRVNSDLFRNNFSTLTTSLFNYSPKTSGSPSRSPIKLRAKSKTKYKRDMVRIKPLELQSKFDLFPQLFSVDDMLEASLETRTKNVYSQRLLRFIDWLKSSHDYNLSIPLYKDLIKSSSTSEIDDIIAKYLVCKFNQRANSGGTLAGDLSAIMFGMQKEGMIISGDLLSSCNRVIKGATNLVRIYKNPNIGLGARALLNPMLNAMLKKCKTPLQRLRLLVPSRFGLRAEHVCCNCKGKSKLDRHLKHKHIFFGPDNASSPKWVSIQTGKDKNHQEMVLLERTVYCSCHLKDYPCVVHELYNYFKDSSPLPPDGCLLRNDDGSPLTYHCYNLFSFIMADLVGLDPSFYTSHAYRKGCASELKLGGMDVMDIKNFGKWKRLGSMDIYVIIDNPDLRKFVQPEEYRIFRDKQGNPGFVRRASASSLAFSENVKLDLVKSKKRSKRNIKIAKITELDKRASLDSQTTHKVDKLVSNSSKLVSPSFVSPVRPIRSTRTKINYNIEYLSSAAGLAATSAKYEDPIPEKRSRKVSAKSNIKFSKTVMDDESDYEVVTPSSSDIDSGED